ncbi:MAG: hypothetical protein HYZ53_29985, partial [Planctomycetes bacterium]|nr:hypothetical protein [Planctomycetota bacterium]
MSTRPLGIAPAFLAACAAVFAAGPARAEDGAPAQEAVAKSTGPSPAAGSDAASNADEKTEAPAPGSAPASDGLFDRLEGKVVIGGQGLSNTDRAAKYLEYRDEPVGVVAPWVELRTISRPDDDYWFKLVAK